MNILDGVHPEWIQALSGVRAEIDRLGSHLEGSRFNPSPENIFRALRTPFSDVSVVIFGQDPYPNPAHAMGLAFSVPRATQPLPKTLTNIFRELHEDTNIETPLHGDLTPWAQQGVALVNRVLTVPSWQSGGHSHLGWQVITDEIARILGARDVVPILWGKYAQEIAPYFNAELVISSPHPSPLSAYRGFFGSKPFSKANRRLALQSRRTIDWSLD